MYVINFTAFLLNPAVPLTLTSATMLRAAVMLTLCWPQVVEMCRAWLDLEASRETSPPTGGVHNEVIAAEPFTPCLPRMPHPPAWKSTEETLFNYFAALTLKTVPLDDSLPEYR